MSEDRPGLAVALAIRNKMKASAGKAAPAKAAPVEAEVDDLESLADDLDLLPDEAVAELKPEDKIKERLKQIIGK